MEGQRQLLKWDQEICTLLPDNYCSYAPSLKKILTSGYATGRYQSVFSAELEDNLATLAYECAIKNGLQHGFDDEG